MPAYAAPISNVLNGVSSAGAGEKTGVRFTAPEARVLIVDDIVTNLNVAKGLLAPYRMDIQTCTGGREAIELLGRQRFDLILMDHMMPDMDGIETAAVIRAMEDEEIKNTPIVALTASAVSGIRDMFLEKGFNDYLAKPVEIIKLDEIMAKYIPRSKRREAGTEAARETFTGDAGINIGGLDVKKGIAMTGGTLGAYWKVLESFYRDAEGRLKNLTGFKDLLPPAGTPGPEDLAAFTTQVHALKSASASVGAALISARAAELEAAGKRGDVESIRQGLEDFCPLLAELCGAIGAALRDRAPAGPIPNAAGDVSPDPALQKALLGLKAALESENIEAIDRCLKELEALVPGSLAGEIYAEISDAVLVSEFPQAIKVIDTLLG
ncbi:MAG: response regulator, partial [Treponema sp.]|jgi:CheY-like chemotaxis protein|nr:response regulator [Treponema sp.]